MLTLRTVLLTSSAVLLLGGGLLAQAPCPPAAPCPPPAPAACPAPAPCAPPVCKTCVPEVKKNTRVVYSSTCKDYCLSCWTPSQLWNAICNKGCCQGPDCVDCGHPRVRHVLIKKNVPDCDTYTCVVKEVPPGQCPPCGNALPIAPGATVAPAAPGAAAQPQIIPVQPTPVQAAPAPVKPENIPVQPVPVEKK